jgi:hypothetical protein
MQRKSRYFENTREKHREKIHEDIVNNFLNRTSIAHEIRMKIENRIASNYKASVHQRKQLPESRDNLHNGRISLPAIQLIKD